MSEMNPEIRDELLHLAQRTDPIIVTLKPWDAWVTVAVIQFACRNPHLGETQRQQAEAVGRALQSIFREIAPAAAELLEDGWNTDKDVPR